MPINGTHYHKTTSANDRKRKRAVESSTSDAYEEPDSAYASGEDEIESYSDYSDARRPKSNGKGKGKAVIEDFSDDVLDQHRAVSSHVSLLQSRLVKLILQFCEKCGLIPADDLLEKARARKKKPGQRRRKGPDEMSDEETAENLGGWLQCQRCVVAMHWVSISLS